MTLGTIAILKLFDSIGRVPIARIQFQNLLEIPQGEFLFPLGGMDGGGHFVGGEGIFETLNPKPRRLRSRTLRPLRTSFWPTLG
jgi:hypothetical protein